MQITTAQDPNTERLKRTLTSNMTTQNMYIFSPFSKSPSYNRNAWLGVKKHQVTSLLTLFQSDKTVKQWLMKMYLSSFGFGCWLHRMKKKMYLSGFSWGVLNAWINAWEFTPGIYSTDPNSNRTIHFHASPFNCVVALKKGLTPNICTLHNVVLN